MKRLISIALLSMICGYGYASAQADKQAGMPPPKPSSPAFDRVKALAGDWEGKMADGTPVRTSYKVVSNGSAVMNVIDPGGQFEMVTIFHMDGPNLMVTHYCAAGNQPRMVAKPGGNPSAIAFAFKDVTNVTKPDEGYMSGLVLKLTDADHHEQEWIFRDKGKDERHETFSFTRKK